MTKELGSLRQQIDEIDAQLVEVLAKRKQLIDQVSEVKGDQGFPIYVPQRERALIEARRAQAEAAGVSPDLIEDLLRRLMRESYQSEGRSGYRTTKPELESVVIVGGRGQMGTLFSDLFRCSGYTVELLDKDDWDKADELLSRAELVIMSVPIKVTLEVIEQLQGRLRPDCALVDLTSLKSEPVEKMLQVHTGPVLGLHPMFGPGVGSLAKQVIVFTPGRDLPSLYWMLEQFRLWGALLLESTPQEHDRMMAVIQALRHFTTYIYGTYLRDQGVDIKRILEFSSPIYRLELAMVGRLFAQDPQLYADIIFSSKERADLVSDYAKYLQQATLMLQTGDKEVFIEGFRQVQEWLGPHTAQFFHESNLLLDRQQEHR